MRYLLNITSPTARAEKRTGRHTMSAVDPAKPCQGQIRIAFSSEEMAFMVKQCMEVDEELQPARLSKDISQQGVYLVV
jgi:uncharacterized protein (DUF2141 family)